MVNKDALLSKWCIGYVEKLRPKLIIDKFSTDNLAQLKETNPRDFNFLWGGEIAAANLTHYLGPQIITLYADDALPLLQYKCRLKKDNDGNIEIIKKFWNFDTKNYKEHHVPFILVYADLLSSLDESFDYTLSGCRPLGRDLKNLSRETCNHLKDFFDRDELTDRLGSVNQFFCEAKMWITGCQNDFE